MMQLTIAQLKAIDASLPALQIISCAGSGKTEVLARRTVRYLLQGVVPESIVAFTFTEKAAEELTERIERRAAEADERFRLLPPSSGGLFVGTIHSYCLRLLQESGGTYEIFDPLPEEREWALLYRFARRLGIVNLMTETWPGQPVSVRKAVEVFRRNTAIVYNERISRAVLESRAPRFAKVLGRYEELLSSMQLLSFDQMIDRACDELAPGGKLAKALDGLVGEVVVDEYQDLNQAQEELLQRLVDLGARLTVVGDDDQAIYQWRGGDVALFLGFSQRYPKSESVSMAENHRSVPKIVDAANAFASTIRQRAPKDMVAFRKDSGPAIELLAAQTAEQEAELLVGRMRSLLEAGHGHAEIAVLFRSVRTSARPIVDVLRREVIPFALVGRLSLLERSEMALLARIFVWWAGGMWRPDEQPEVITPQRLINDVAQLTHVDNQKADRILAQLERLGRNLVAEGVKDIIGTYLQVLRIIGLPTDGPERRRQEQGLAGLSQLLTDFEHMQRRAAPVDWLRGMTPPEPQATAEEEASLYVGQEQQEAAVKKSHGAAFLNRLRIFLEAFASRAAEEAVESPVLDPDAINIMTVHQAKGLEFPIVFVPALVDRRFPSARMGAGEPWYIPDDLFDQERYQGREDDERRLFYVAMTRARELLVLSWFNKYKQKPAVYSRFIKDLVQVANEKDLKRAGQCKPWVRLKRHGDPPNIATDFGQLLTFSECPYKFYLRHLCGFEPPIAPELGYGKLLHHVVAELARKSKHMGAPNTDEAEQVLSNAFYLPFAGPIERERLYKAAHRRLLNYVKNYGYELVRTIEPERRFEVPIGYARVRGRVDLLLKAEGGGPSEVELVDFKTSANRPPSRQHENQLRLYAEAIRALGMNPVSLAIHDLDADNGGRILVEESENEKSVFRDELHQWIEDIRLGRFQKRPRREVCSSCDLKNLC